ncbi:PaaI family thioesterase [Thalassolituus sp.]|jgi:uncharacterized protein (TIGR00369 family)|uniref:PaaI family thioesterase n=1 Tax=Thalassolituus sp. TaxID=2030822 RepID=UPI002607E692|nr:PaaI family thioesterase [uncultured Thalassolituus sp.]TNC92112.1 MAG: thioesterase [Thalassolituus sp.]
MSDTLTVKASRFVSVLPHCTVLGMTVLHGDENGVQMSLPYSEQIIGNPASGVVAGGSLTTLMDTACGTAVFVALPGNELCPTLDLRVDYMRAARPGSDLIAQATVVRVTTSVVFTRCDVYQEINGERKEVARCTANFMRIGKQIGGAA